MKLPHQVLGAAFGRVRAPGARTAAPKVKNCRTGATMSSSPYVRNHMSVEVTAFHCSVFCLLLMVMCCLLAGFLGQWDPWRQQLALC